MRRAQGADAAVMRALSLEATRESPENFVVTYDEEAALPLAHYVDEIEKGWVFIAKGDQGMIALRPDGWVHTAYVRPGSRGCGVGDLLVSAVVDTAQAQGMAQLSLGVFAQNTHAVALYQRHGFAEVSRTPRGARMDCVMARRL